jgi:hypothetical protein
MQPTRFLALAIFAVATSTFVGSGVARADDPKDFGSWFLIKSADHGEYCMDASLDAGEEISSRVVERS